MFKLFQRVNLALIRKQHLEAGQKALFETAQVAKAELARTIPGGAGGNMYRLTSVKRLERYTQLLIDVPYAEYQHEGRRRDGTHVIRKRPAGGQSFYTRDPLRPDKLLKNATTFYKKFL